MPGSVFIMDVTKSSYVREPSKLTKHLHDTVEWIYELSKMNPDSISLIHRFGDEILLVARGFETAYLIAFYVMATWAFPEHPPYFGIGYGDLATEFPNSKELETWNSPVAKYARRSADKLKYEKSSYRKWLLFDDEDEGNRGMNEVLNEYAQIQDRFFKQQTEADHLASALYTIHDLQEWIANKLDKNRSTISRQVRKSNVDVILTTKNRIAERLHYLEQFQMQLSIENIGKQSFDKKFLTTTSLNEIVATIELLTEFDDTEQAQDSKQVSPRLWRTMEPRELDSQIRHLLKYRVNTILKNMIERDK